MEATLGISLYSYLYLKLAKMLCLFISDVFSSTKSENKRAELILPGSGEAVGVWPRQCIHMGVNVKCKNDKIKKLWNKALLSHSLANSD
jgi:hypothetical protein